jgi:phage terminase small subunit
MRLPKLNTLKHQQGKLGRPFRASGIEKILSKPPKWINGVEKYCWKYTFKYLDEKGGFFQIDIDWDGKLIDKRTL